MALVCSLVRQSTLRHAASVHQSSGERGSSNKDQVKKQAALDGAHVESFDRLCQVINNTADVTICKSGEAERHFSKLQSERRKT